MTKQQEPNNGKVETQQVFQLDDDTKKALMKIAQEEGSASANQEDPTKFTLLNDALVKSVSDEDVFHFTDYLDKDEVLEQIDLEMHAKLIPLVFGNMQGVPENRQKQRIDFLNMHANLFRLNKHEFAVHRMSLKKGTKLSLVHAVRNDTSVQNVDKDVKKMFGGR